MKKSQKFALGIGIILIVYFILVNPIIVSDSLSLMIGSAVLFLTNIGVRLFTSVFCFNIADQLKRSVILWFIIGLAFPAYSLIVIAFVKPKKEKI